MEGNESFWAKLLQKGHDLVFPRKICVGILLTLRDSTVNYKHTLDSLNIKPANAIARKDSSGFWFCKHPRDSFILVPDTNYLELLRDLENCKIDFAFSSPYTYLYYKYGMNPISTGKSITVIAIRQQKVGGQQYETGFVYYSYIVWNKKFNFDTLFRDTSHLKIFMGGLTSTSTFVIPSRYMLEHGINIFSLQMKEKVESELLQDTIIHRLLRSGNMPRVGFLSSSDYLSLPKIWEDSLNMFPISIPIPSDPIVVRYDFDKEIGNDYSNIIKAITQDAGKPSAWDFPWFENYVCSGVVTHISGDLTAYAWLPSKSRDLHHLNGKYISGSIVHVIHFEPGIAYEDGEIEKFLKDSLIQTATVLRRVNDQEIVLRINSINSATGRKSKVSVGDHIIISQAQ